MYIKCELYHKLHNKLNLLSSKSICTYKEAKLGSHVEKGVVNAFYLKKLAFSSTVLNTYLEIGKCAKHSDFWMKCSVNSTSMGGTLFSSVKQFNLNALLTHDSVVLAPCSGKTKLFIPCD